MKRITILLSAILLSAGSIIAQNTLATLRSQYDQKGNPKGEYLFPKAKGANLRILDINIWEWNGTKDKLPKAWIEAGADCTNETRNKGYIGMYKAYLPEVICLQEYAKQMHQHMYPDLQEMGYETAAMPEEGNYTPIFYDTKRVQLIETAYYSHDLPYNNHGTKSFTTAVFKLKKNGKKFIVVNTHLWWKSEAAMQGSDDARLHQLQRIMVTTRQLWEKYDCPVFLMGDMNCNLKSVALSNVLNHGYKPAWKIATEYGDLRCGHHKCSKDGFSRDQNKPDDGTGCIDHFLVFDPENKVEVKVFMRDYAWYTVKLTDHYPNYADINL